MVGNDRQMHRNRQGKGHTETSTSGKRTTAPASWPAFLDHLTYTAAALLDSRGRLICANRAFLHTAGIVDSPPFGQPIPQLAHQLDWAALVATEPTAPQEPVFAGPLVLGALTEDGGYPLFGRVFRSGGDLLLVVESELPEPQLLASSLAPPNAQLAEAQRALKRSHEQLRAISLVDPLTGLANRRGLEERLELEMARIQRTGQRLCVARMDIDHFTEVNERYGHEAGDAVLKDAAELLGENLRAIDLAARYGGEEFCLVFSDTRLDKAVLAMERLRKLIAARPIPPLEQPVTASFGVAIAAFEESPEALLRRADEALNKAKQAGRNRVCVAE